MNPGFKTRYGEPIARILAAYPPGSMALITALETLIGTAQEHVRTQLKDEIARSVCEGLHIGEGSGLKCRMCHEAEMGFVENVPSMDDTPTEPTE